MPKIRAPAAPSIRPPRQIVARVHRDGLDREESFATKVDADHWLDMMHATLEHRDKVAFNLEVYATGLAESVRTYGGPFTREKWLNDEAPPEP